MLPAIIRYHSELILTFTVSGKDLMASRPEDISLIGMTSGNKGELFKFVDDPNDFDGGMFTLFFGGAIFSGDIVGHDTYELVVFIKDGDTFDLDGLVNGEVIAAIFLASEGKDSGSGCNTYGYLALAILGVVPFVFRRK